MVPELLTYYNVTLIDAEALKDFINIAMIITTIIGATTTYGKDAYYKLQTLLGAKENKTGVTIPSETK